MVLSWMSAPHHEVVGGRRIIVVFFKGIEKKAQEASSHRTISHPRRSAVTTHLTSFQGLALRWPPKFPSPRHPVALALFRALRAKPGRSATFRQWFSVCSGPGTPCRGYRFVPGLACKTGAIGHSPAMVVGLFRAWRVARQRDDRPLLGNGLRFVPGLVCNASAGRSAISRRWSSICSGLGV
jgi:hypothetical protein